MKYKILNDAGEVVNTIVADLAFVNAVYPDRYREAPPPPPPLPEEEPDGSEV